MKSFITTPHQNQLLCESAIKDNQLKSIEGLCPLKSILCQKVNIAYMAQSGKVVNQISRVMSYVPSGTVPPTVVHIVSF
jgi:hypothetical protein